MRRPTAAQSAEPSRDRALRRNAGVEKSKRSRDIRNRAVHDAIYYRETPADAPLIDAELLFRQPEPALSVNCSGSHVRVIPGYGARSQCKSLRIPNARPRVLGIETIRPCSSVSRSHVFEPTHCLVGDHQISNRLFSSWSLAVIPLQICNANSENYPLLSPSRRGVPRDHPPR